MIFAERSDTPAFCLLRYELDQLKKICAMSSLAACYLLSQYADFKLRTVKMSRKGVDQATEVGVNKMNAKEFVERFPSIEDFVREYDHDCESWYISFIYNGALIAFAGNIESPTRVTVIIADQECKLSWCKENDIDIEKLLTSIEEQSQQL